MNELYIMGGALVGLGVYVMYHHRQIKFRDYVIGGIVSGSIKIAELEGDE
mgnify:CR=1 FL=1